MRNYEMLDFQQLCIFRTAICTNNTEEHTKNVDKCRFSHCATWPRRNPLKVQYHASLCENIKFSRTNKKMKLTQKCKLGKSCRYAHSKEEELYHPLYYKTQMCRKFPTCERYFCPFAHQTEELRHPLEDQLLVDLVTPCDIRSTDTKKIIENNVDEYIFPKHLNNTGIMCEILSCTTNTADTNSLSDVTLHDSLLESSSNRSSTVGEKQSPVSVQNFEYDASYINNIDMHTSLSVDNPLSFLMNKKTCAHLENKDYFQQFLYNGTSGTHKKSVKEFIPDKISKLQEHENINGNIGFNNLQRSYSNYYGDNKFMDTDNMSMYNSEKSMPDKELKENYAVSTMWDNNMQTPVKNTLQNNIECQSIAAYNILLENILANRIDLTDPLQLQLVNFLISSQSGNSVQDTGNIGYSESANHKEYDSIWAAINQQLLNI